MHTLNLGVGQPRAHAKQIKNKKVDIYSEFYRCGCGHQNGQRHGLENEMVECTCLVDVWQIEKCICRGGPR